MSNLSDASSVDSDGERITSDSEDENRKEAASREYLLGPHLGYNEFSGSPCNGRNEPPADVLAGFCAFSFRPSNEHVHNITDRGGNGPLIPTKGASSFRFVTTYASSRNARSGWLSTFALCAS